PARLCPQGGSRRAQAGAGSEVATPRRSGWRTRHVTQGVGGTGIAPGLRPSSPVLHGSGRAPPGHPGAVFRQSPAAAPPAKLPALPLAPVAGPLTGRPFPPKVIDPADAPRLRRAGTPLSVGGFKQYPHRSTGTSACTGPSALAGAPGRAARACAAGSAG